VAEIAANRDPKGLYKKALAGELAGFTGVDPDARMKRRSTPSSWSTRWWRHPRHPCSVVLTTLAALGYLESDQPMIQGDRMHSGMTDLRVQEYGARRQGTLSLATIRSCGPSRPIPIADPAGYQRHLLGLLGDDDPAAVQSATAASVRALLGSAGADAATAPEPTEWSVVQCLAHITDAELVVSGRYRWILAHDRPPLMGYDQDRWVDQLIARPSPPRSCCPSSNRSARRTSRSGIGRPKSGGIASGCTPSAGPRATN
jgi:hypothetical protein